jgi:hypothetical protein
MLHWTTRIYRFKVGLGIAIHDAESERRFLVETLPWQRRILMKKGFFGIAALSVILAAGSASGADDATSRCQEYAKEDVISAGEMKDYMEQCLEDQRMVSAEIDQQAEGNTSSASDQND